jgi:DNA-binding MarR family transcriptional regulator
MMPLRLADMPEPLAPATPKSVEDTGVPFLFLAELACKIACLTGPQRLAELASRLKLAPSLVEPIVDFLRRERLCEVATSSSGSAPVFALTGLGRERAEEYLRISRYAGPAPVSLADYVAQVKRQAFTDQHITRERMAQAFAGVIVREEVLDQFGAAMNSGRAIFVYGPAGSGKTFIAEHLAGLFADAIYVPHAILAGGQVIQVLDHHSHVPAPDTVASAPAFVRPSACDARWVRCRRPAVVTGGELTLGMLDLQFDAGSRFYVAPPQLKANNGLFVIDDLGRQLVRPQELMNRWIVPLDRRVDYLATHTGEKFQVPFEVTVVFATNLSPAALADEAFLRRLGYKIYLGPLERAAYRALCEQVCATLGLEYREAAIDHLLARFAAEGRPLLACTPRDLFTQVRDRARYQGVAPEITEELLDWACCNYFAHESLQSESEETVR